MTPPHSCFSVLTGLFPPDPNSGPTTLYGHSIKDDISSARKVTNPAHHSVLQPLRCLIVRHRAPYSGSRHLPSARRAFRLAHDARARGLLFFAQGRSADVGGGRGRGGRASRTLPHVRAQEPRRERTVGGHEAESLHGDAFAPNYHRHHHPIIFFFTFSFFFLSVVSYRMDCLLQMLCLLLVSTRRWPCAAVASS
jgi:hypothetical protein